MLRRARAALDEHLPGSRVGLILNVDGVGVGPEHEHPEAVLHGALQVRQHGAGPQAHLQRQAPGPDAHLRPAGVLDDDQELGGVAPVLREQDTGLRLGVIRGDPKLLEAEASLGPRNLHALLHKLGHLLQQQGLLLHLLVRRTGRHASLADDLVHSHHLVWRIHQRHIRHLSVLPRLRRHPADLPSESEAGRVETQSASSTARAPSSSG
mmetsp:Transcript_14595/g.55137  ORF Transcript_14595/g.55137 Transcript_14595/m.55137 type:complete len:209 (+) Transcript_14595:1598-2224(+)